MESLWYNKSTDRSNLTPARV